MNRANRPRLSRISGSSYASKLLGRAGDGPTLTLDFTTGQLDPRLTFTRSSIGTYYRGAFNQNLLLRSQEFDNTTSWTVSIGGTGVAPVRTPDNAVAPDGTTTADTITFNTGANTTSSDFCLLQQIGAATVTGRTYTFSIWIRGTVGGEKLTMRGVAAAAFTLVTATTSWQRITITSTAATGTVQVGIYQNISGHGVINSTATVELWGAQLTEGSLLTPYIPTTTAAITQGQIASAAIDVPRFENDPVTGEARGLLIEGTATNLLNWSESFDTSGGASNNWADTNITRNSTNNTDPASGTTALRVTASAGNGTIISTAAMGTSAQRTFSIWLRRVSGTGNIQYTLDNGSTYTTQAITSSWVRYTFAATTAAQRVGIRIVTSGDSIELWGAQLETGSGASSYIPTGASTVTRLADSCVMTGTNFSLWFAGATEGVLFAECHRPTKIPTPAADHAIVGTRYVNGQGLWVYASATNQYPSAYIFPTGGAQFAGGIATQIPLISKQAVRWFDGNDITNFGNGTQGSTNTAGTGTMVPTMLTIGANSTTGTEATIEWFNGCIRRVKFWPTALPNATIQAITT